MQSMTISFDVCIRGSGMVGSTLALMLARQRLRVALVGAPSPIDDMRAFALNTRSQELLSDLRCWPDNSFATPVHSMRIWGDQGGAVNFEAPYGQVLNHIVDVGALEKLLHDAVNFQHSIERFSTPVEATLTVICEGHQSTTRQELGIDFQSMPYAQHALATRVRCERHHLQQALQWFQHHQGDLSILALLPLGGPQGQEAAVVWSLPSAQAHSWSTATDEDLSLALSQASQYSLGALHVSTGRHIWPLQTAQATQWCGRFANGNSWVLAGDAAHTVHPLAGMGLNLGIADVAALSHILALREGKDYWRNVGDMYFLRRYERERKAGLMPISLACDGLQRVFSHPHALAQSLRNWGMNQFDHLSHLKQWTVHQAMKPTFS